MFSKRYRNFVKASSPEPVLDPVCKPVLSGEEARKLYLEEVQDAKTSVGPKPNKGKSYASERRKTSRKDEDLFITNKDLFVTIQNNDVDRLKSILEKHPDKVGTIDEYGWSLLMIACQANAVDTAKELLERGIDISVRDKAGNSARSLVIKNKNFALVDLLLGYRESPATSAERVHGSKTTNEEYTCNECNRTFPDRDEHLSSTIHNISASKGKKIPAHYVIPATNRGYQIMLKGGWDRDSGLGRDGSGKKYPIKTVQKKDRKGLGQDKRKLEHKNPENSIKHKSRQMFVDNCKRNRRLEINFRREFY